MSTLYVRGKFTYVEHADIRHVVEEDDGYFVDWLKWKYGYTHDVSSLVSFIRVMLAMSVSRVPDALIVEEDTLFPKEWEVPVKDDDVFIFLGPGAYWCTLEFAEKFLDNLNISEDLDVVLEGLLFHMDVDVKREDIAQKISLLTSWERPTRSDNAIAFIHGYGGLPKVDFPALVKEYEMYWVDKKEVQRRFKEKYGVGVDIKILNF